MSEMVKKAWNQVHGRAMKYSLMSLLLVFVVLAALFVTVGFFLSSPRQKVGIGKAKAAAPVQTVHVNLPDCEVTLSSGSDLAVLNTNASARVFCLSSGTYQISEFRLTRSGSQGSLVYLREAPGADAVIIGKVFLAGADWWVIDGVTFRGRGPGSDYNLVEFQGAAENNVFNNVIVENGYNNVAFSGGSYNTIQNSIIRSSRPIPKKDSQCIAMYSPGWKGPGNRFLNNKIYNCAADGIQMSAGEWPGTIIEGNEFFMTPEMYSDGQGNRTPTGNNACGEDGLDIKNTGATAAQPMIVRRNSFHGFRWTDTNCAGSGGPGVALKFQVSGSTGYPAARHIIAENNVIYDTMYGFGIYGGANNITIRHNTFVDNWSGDFRLLDKINLVVQNNLFINAGGDKFLGNGNLKFSSTSGVTQSGAPYRLVAGSAAIDAGVSAGVGIDYDGNSRPAGSAPDVGAFEYGASTDPTGFPTATPIAQPTPTPRPDSTASFGFSAAGDFGRSSNTNLVMQSIRTLKDQGNQFHIALGDLAYDGAAAGNPAGWCNYVKGYVGSDFPFQLIVGNHEDYNEGNGKDYGNNIDGFAGCLPGISGISGAYAKRYYVDYPSNTPIARFILISPGLYSDSGQSNVNSYNTGTANYDWLVAAIDGARSAKIPWVVVGMHYKCLGLVGGKPCYYGSDLLNLLINKRVDVVLQAHDHNYLRSKQLACASIGNPPPSGCIADDGADDTYSKGAGTVFLTVGTGGRSLYGIDTTDSEVDYFAKYSGGTYGVLDVDLTRQKLSARFERSSGAELTDSFTIVGAADTPTPTAGPSMLPTSSPVYRGDADGDDDVDESDYTIFSQHYNMTVTSGAQEGDFNVNGLVDIVDYSIWLTSFTGPGLSGPSPTAPSVLTPVPTGSPPAGKAVQAFPEAEGFGANALGGRGDGTQSSRVIEVTNLNDSGLGSLRAAVEATGPRFVVFRVSGIIRLTGSLNIHNPYIYIAGQTAPGYGVTLRGYPLTVRTHDVVIRYLRFRLGTEGIYEVDPTSADSLSLLSNKNNRYDVYNVVIDHNSISWATDENAQAWWEIGSRPMSDITFQWNIFSEALNINGHSKGLIIGGGAKNVSIHHNLFAHNMDRNPEFQGNRTYDLRNNLVYNYGANGVKVKPWYTDQGSQWINIVNNFFKSGPSSAAPGRSVYFHYDSWDIANPVTQPIYISGNIDPDTPSPGDLNNQWQHIVYYPSYSGRDFPNRSYYPTGYRVDTPHPVPVITTQSADEIYNVILDNAGAALPQRDPIDTRVIQDVRNGNTGRIINNSNESCHSLGCGYLPSSTNQTHPIEYDTDRDGMPDSWETANGLNSASAADAVTDADGDGYLNVEEFLNGTNPTR